jgi:hypothetical protein
MVGFGATVEEQSLETKGISWAILWLGSQNIPRPARELLVKTWLC